MSAISVLEVQFDNNVQFLPESKIPFPPAFKFREEELAALTGKGALQVREIHVMKQRLHDS